MNSLSSHTPAFAELPANSLNTQVLAAVSDAVITLDLDLMIRSWNPGAKKIYEWEAEEAIGKKITELLGAKATEYQYASIGNSQATHDSWDFEATHYKKDKTLLDVLCRISVLKNYDGQPAGFLTVNSDITKPRRAEKLSMLQTTALNAATHAIVITDSTGKIEWVNEAFTRLTEYMFSEAVGTNLWTLSRSEMQDARMLEEIKERLSDGKTWTGEIINCRKNNTYYYERMTIAPVNDTGNAASHLICTKQDITARIVAESELKKQNDILNKIAWLQAHKVRSPVATLLGLVQIFNMKDPADPLNREVLQYVQTTAQQLDTVIREIVEQSQLGGAGEESHCE